MPPQQNYPLAHHVVQQALTPRDTDYSKYLDTKPNSKSHNGPGIHPAAIFGIVAGVMIFLFFTMWILFFCVWKKALTDKEYGVLPSIRIAANRHNYNGLNNDGNTSSYGGGAAPYYGGYSGVPGQESAGGYGNGPYGRGEFPSSGMPPGYYSSGNHGGYHNGDSRDVPGDHGKGDSGGVGAGTGTGGGDGGMGGGSGTASGGGTGN